MEMESRAILWECQVLLLAQQSHTGLKKNLDFSLFYESRLTIKTSEFSINSICILDISFKVVWRTIRISDFSRKKPSLILVIHLKERSVCVGKSQGTCQCQSRHCNEKKEENLFMVWELVRWNLYLILFLIHLKVFCLPKKKRENL